MEGTALDQNPLVVGHDAMTAAVSSLLPPAATCLAEDDLDLPRLDREIDAVEYDRAWGMIHAEFGDTHCYDCFGEAWQLMESFGGYHLFRHRGLGDDGYLYRSYDVSPGWPRSRASAPPTPDESASAPPDAPAKETAEQLRRVAGLASQLATACLDLDIRLGKSVGLPEGVQGFAQDCAWAVGDAARGLRATAAGAAFLIDGLPRTAARIDAIPRLESTTVDEFLQRVALDAESFGESEERRRTVERAAKRR